MTFRLPEVPFLNQNVQKGSKMTKSLSPKQLAVEGSLTPQNDLMA